MDFERARHWMVEAQVRTNDVTHPGLQDAMRRLPRERFVPADKADLAYSDLELDVGFGRVLLRPRDLAKILQALQPQPGESALEIAGGTGYGGAVLAAAGCSVVTLEAEPALTHAAQAAISACGLNSVLAASSDLKSGFPDRAPFDMIFVNGAVEVVPDTWTAQLGEGGRLAVIVRNGPAGSLRIYTKANGQIAYRTVFDAAPPVIQGLGRPASFVF